MAHTTEQKIKLLVLYDILCKNTDEDHALNTDEIIAMLAEKNIKVARRKFYLNVQNGTMNAKMEKIADYIEFGTKNYKTIELQKFGFSRELSLYVLKKHVECLEFIDNELDKINFGKLFDEFNKENALYEELKEYQYLKI